MTLLKKLRAATGPDREIDAEIYLYLHAHASRCEYHDQRECGYVLISRRIEESPRFTASIDAAVSLIPPDHDWSVFSDGIAGCEPTDPDGDGCMNAVYHGETPALALCIAALSARETMP